MLIEIIISLIVISIITYKWLTLNYDYFEKQGIPYIKPTVLLGSLYGFLFGKESLREEFLRYYQKYKDLKGYGVFEGRNPRLVINDLDLIKKITVKDFEFFKNHDAFVDVKDDPLFGNSVFAMTDEKWHDMRTTLSPAFTGSKMRLMFTLIMDVCNKAVKFLDKHFKNNSNAENGVDFEMKEFFSLFTNDAIASVAFGLEVNSLEDKNNEFYKMGREVTTFTTWQLIKFTLYATFKKIFQLLGISMENKKFSKYFNRLVIDAMKYRKENNIVRQDMINMLMEAQTNPNKSHNRQWTDEELVAQCFIFLFAGLESNSTTLCFATQELIENPDVQEKLYEEIKDVTESLNGAELTYDHIKQMKYMEMFMSEVLRKWPPFIQGDRMCTKPYEINEDGFKIKLRPGDIIWLPVIGLHLNDNYFKNPMKFDPERFNDENKANIKPMSYLPFGNGPRMCIANRLALLECKMILIQVLKNYRLDVSKKSHIPVKLAATSFPIIAKDGFWLKMVPRK